MDPQSRVALEREYHESEDQARNANRLIPGVYSSGLFDEALAYHLAALGDLHELHVLDYGCGGGDSAGKLADRGARVTGFDISETRLAEARQYLSVKGANDRVSLVQCPGGKLPFGDATFDGVFGKWILHHLDLEEDIGEIIRVLRPGGRAAFVEPLIHNPVLQAYRRLTPHLRSPGERALSMQDMRALGSQFRSWSHREFVLLSVFPALAGALASGGDRFGRMQLWAQRVDRRLLETQPFLRRYCWETVIVLQR